VADIPVREKLKALVFLHAATSMGARPSLTLGFYRVRYEDGSSAKIPICYGHNIGPWIYSLGTGNKRMNSYYGDGHLDFCRLACQGRTAMGEKTGLYVYEWVNPHPDTKIVSIDMEVSVDRDIRVALVALSAVK